MIAETWRPVVGFEASHSISNLAQVRSEPRIVQLTGPKMFGERRVLGRILAQHKDPQGYLRVTLGFEGELYSMLIHTMLLEAFVCPRPEGMNGLHWDDNELNNDISNLRWGTQVENGADCVRNGHNRFANRTHCDNGHEFTEDNITWRTPTKRKCRTCARDYIRQRRAGKVES